MSTLTSGELDGQQQLFAAQLLAIVVSFIDNNEGVPVKKAIILLWKTVLVSCGGFDELHARKAAVRAAVGLPPLPQSGAKDDVITPHLPPKSSTQDIARFVQVHFFFHSFCHFTNTNHIRMQSPLPSNRHIVVSSCSFREHTRNKFYGYKDAVSGDIGVPPSVTEALSILEKVIIATNLHSCCVDMSRIC